MTSIVNFCWRELAPVVRYNAVVGELYNEAQARIAQRNSEPFLFTDPAHRRSALVIPDLVTATVEQEQLPLHESAQATGLLDVLSRDQLVIHQDQPASRAIRLALQAEAALIIAVDDNGFPVGLSIPNELVERLPHSSPVLGSPRLQGIIANVSATSDLPWAIQAIEEEVSDFHSEVINLAAIEPYICEDHGKPHIRSQCPCDRHPNSPCQRRPVSTT